MATVDNWPPHRTETRAWDPRNRARGAKGDRMLTHVDVSIPPFIADCELDLTGDLARRHDEALIAVTRLEAGAGRHLTPFGEFLLRSESLASSKIEEIDGGWTAFGKALGGGKASAAAQSQLAAVRALTAMVDDAVTRPITAESFLDAHRLLMESDVSNASDAGRFREVQNWIGGSDYSPLGAMFVPPPPELVAPMMEDLMAFIRRTDLPVVAQAAVAHAQFESIHPFVDGNGRIGRALISSVLRRRGLTQRITVPLASVMLADTDKYFAMLTRYRTGGCAEFVEYLANAAIFASECAVESAVALAELPELWRKAATPRARSADAALIDGLLQDPILNIDTAMRITGTTEASTYAALDRLTEAGVLELLSSTKRNRIWAAIAALAEVDALTVAIGRRSRL